MSIKFINMSDYNRAAKACWFVLVAALSAVLVCGALVNFGVVYVLLSLIVIGATGATYRIYFERMNEKTVEAAEMSRLHLATVEALATAIDAKDQTTHCHVRRVQIYATGVGALFGLSKGEIEALRAGALLHDVGNLAVPDHILNKPGDLTPAEFEKMKIHTEVGAQILEQVNFPYPVIPIVLHHHERWDGKGYPAGLKGEAIPITARILAVVDSFDTVREDRPYRRGMTREEASALLRRGAATHFDPNVVEVFLRNLEGFEAEITESGLEEHLFTDAGDTTAPCSADEIPGGAQHVGENLHPAERGVTGALSYPAHGQPVHAQPAYLKQIRNAHTEVYTLYEIARMFGSSLDLQDVLSIIIDKVGNVVPFDTCAVFLYDELKNLATVAHAAGRDAEHLRNRTVAPGEGVTGFVLANRYGVHRFDPSLDLAGITLSPDSVYRSVASLPLMRGEHLLGALTIYSLAPDAYTEDHLRLLDTIARLASDALANAMHHAEMESNALTDALTGLPNARALHVRFEEEAARARRTRRGFQVVMLDLDDFKLVNDTFGHKTGDVLLREVGRILHTQLREYDFLARYAGDEFVALVQDMDEVGIRDLRERIEAAVTDFRLPVGVDRHARVGISVGSANFTAHGETLDGLLVAADAAMYNRKSHHRRLRADRDAGAGEPVADIPTGTLASSAIN